MNRKIIHVDMDCFYAQVEMRDNPALKNVPLAIGGRPGTRSVLCTSNYIARTYGVKSAMPTDFAIKLCPKLVVLPPNFKKYSEASDIIHSIFWKYSDAVESVSLDEAYLDVSHAENATEIGKKIKADIFESTGLTCSVGVAPNKFLSKIASDWKKPNGLFVIRPHEVENFIVDLPVKLIPGVGKKSAEYMESLGIKTCRDIRNTAPEVLTIAFGKFSQTLVDYAQGIDEREVVTEWERKSLSVENTFLKDLTELQTMQAELMEVYEEMKERLQRHLTEEPHKKIKKLFVKVKYADFKQLSSEESIIPFDLNEARFEEALNFENFVRLLRMTLLRKNAPVRLLGCGVRFLTPDESSPVQLSFLPLCG